ncbi:MAG: putative enzyme related to lactoylglutathione lyase [Pseudohongiellaceae bacterium]|jgi:predicted enzyme related to lactoylglutathione lyase
MNDTPINPMKQHGAFSWNELMSTDVEGAKTFYSEMFSWEIVQADSEMPYFMAKVNGQEVSGLMQTPPEANGMPSMWGGYVTVDNVNESAKQADSLGGKVIMEPRDIPNVGRFCVVSDPQGAMLSLITYFDKS